MTANDNSESSDSLPVLKAEDWWAMGHRVPYDPARKRIVKKESPATLRVWQRIYAPYEVTSQSRWLTMMPGVPDSSYSYSKIEGLLQTAPRLYFDFVGLGDSDKPTKYPHSTMERANLVEAQWKHHKIRRTVLIAQSCSSLVALELLCRQRERLALGLPVRTRIEHVLFLNGAYFAHTHKKHPLNTPLMKPVQKAVMKAAQHSDCVIEGLIRGCFAKDYDLKPEELQQIAANIRNRKGTSYFYSSANKYVEEHQENAERWNLVNIYKTTRKQGISFMIIAGTEDKYERRAFDLAKEQLEGNKDIYFETLPGGFNLLIEQPRRTAAYIDGLAMAPAFDDVWGAGFTASKRSSIASSDASSTQSSTAHSTLNPSSAEGWADAEFPEEYEGYLLGSY